MRIWLGITLLILIAYAIKRARDRRLLRRWDDDDSPPPPEETVH